MAPLLTVWLAGVPDREKSPVTVTVTVSVTVAVRTTEPLVPRMVNGYDPAGVVLLVETVSVVVPDAAIEGGLNAHVVFAGRPVTLKSTVPVNCGPGNRDTVNVVLAVGAMACTAGVAEIETLDTVTVRVAGARTTPSSSVTVKDAR